MTQPRARRRTVHTDQHAAGACRCRGGRPTTIAAFRQQQLVTVRRRHHPRDCGLPDELVDAREYQRT